MDKDDVPQDERRWVPAVSEVGQDAEVRPSSGPLRDFRRESLSHRVDGVRSHGISRVNHEVRDDHWATGSDNNSNLRG